MAPREPILDREISIERYTTAPNTLNEEIKTWAPYVTRWAARRDAASAENVKAGDLGSYQISWFVVRSDTETRTITAADRFTHDGSTWEIRERPKETQHGRNRYLEITGIRDAD